jgi:hypothetical protein
MKRSAKGFWFRFRGIKGCQEIQSNFEASYITSSSNAQRLFFLALTFATMCL